MHSIDALEDSAPSTRSSLRSWPTAVVRLLSGLLLFPLACSSEDKAEGEAPAAGTGGSAGGSVTEGGGSGGGSAPVGGGSTKSPFGRFTLTLNPAIEDAPAYASIFGKVYDGPYPTDVIETVIASDENCKVYKFSLQACFDPSCTGEQTCVAKNVCEAKPSPVSVGDVSVAGVGASSLKLSLTNLNYQYPLELPYPGIVEGEAVTLGASGADFAAFTISAKGVAPITTAEPSYFIENGQPLTIEWTPGDSSVGAEITATLNISKHGGSAGYMLCTTTDTGSLTIGADVLTALVDLGVAGFPELLLTRSTQGEAVVDAGKVTLHVEAVAKPPLDIEGYCSCFNDSDCGSCTDKTKSSCDSLKRTCITP
jgi:hypothetical protein